MLGAGLEFNQTKIWQNYEQSKSFNKFDYNNNNNQKKPILGRTQSDIVNGGKCGGVDVVSGFREPENGIRDVVKPVESNLERFLEGITPFVHAQYLSKTTMRGLKTCDVEFQPYFLLSDLWDSFKEWSAYGAGVPLVLNGSASVVQYYVPYLSGIQIYIDQSKSAVKSSYPAPIPCNTFKKSVPPFTAAVCGCASCFLKARCNEECFGEYLNGKELVDYLCTRRTSEDSDVDYLSRDSSSDGSSDSERDRALTYSVAQQNLYSLPSDISFKMEGLLSKHQDTALHEGFSSDEGGESGTAKGSLLFQYFEHAPPYLREPLADKISDLALQFPELNSLRSCDLLSSSWLSVAWYPIYRIPTGPTLKDLDACFLTYHSLSTPVGDVPAAETPVMVYPNAIDGIPRIALPVNGLSSYKLRGPVWTANNGIDGQLANSLLQAADSWLRHLQVNHPDYLFFSRNR